ncbi:hypothetical protein CDL15_Pgr018683 [Punica granatum]|uniref:Uncharacterized protein n=1 Tax=Punica granatum TaxID=22663 RepID=A0A218VW37_PUNGR|nr:hypothetical protein CDL15_Pgr018683 [Punica granatum]PKI57163.1 hypothetical protein CRG98_022453 [Punica granatum]
MRCIKDIIVESLDRVGDVQLSGQILEWVEEDRIQGNNGCSVTSVVEQRRRKRFILMSTMGSNVAVCSILKKSSVWCRGVHLYDPGIYQQGRARTSSTL